MKRLFLATCLIATLTIGPAADARSVDVGRGTLDVARNLSWSDLSSKIPATVLDEHVAMPVFSFAASRGDEWLAGNPNQLVQVTSKSVIDLTPALKDSGFRGIRQIASDGQQWLVVGDSGYWQAEPDLAYRYDGKYWTNVSFIMAQLPAQEWVGQIVGRRGNWLIPTKRGLYMWNTGLEQIAAVKLPEYLTAERQTPLAFYPIRDAWLIAATEGDKLRIFRFDGERTNEITSQFAGLSHDAVIATNGLEVLAAGLTQSGKTQIVTAVLSDGVRAANVSRSIITMDKAKQKNPTHSFWTDGCAVWNGKYWIVWDAEKNMAVFDGRVVSRLPATRDRFLEAGYGSGGSALFVGYSSDHGIMRPKLVLAMER